MLTMLLHDRAEKLFYWNRYVQDLRSRAVERGDVSPLLKFATVLGRTRTSPRNPKPRVTLSIALFIISA